MRYLVSFLALSVLVPTAAASAQTWSPEEQEVLDQLAECWDTWMEGVQSGSPDRWISECSTPTSSFWPASDGAPFGNDFIRRNWPTIQVQDLGWVDIRPVKLAVTSDLAVVHFYGYWMAPGENGETVTEAKRTEVFRRINGRWKVIAGHGTPLTVADAAPYRRGG